MSDEERRRRERGARAGDEAARVRVLHDRLRQGALLEWRVALAAYCGDEAAFEALSPEAKQALIDHEWQVFDLGGRRRSPFAPEALQRNRERLPAIVKEVVRLFSNWTGMERIAEALGTADARTAIAAARAAAKNESWPEGPRAALEVADELGRGPFGGASAAFAALSRAVTEAELAAIIRRVDVPPERPGRRERQRQLSLAAWARGLERWGSLVLVRVVVACERVLARGGPIPEEEAVARWLREPRRENEPEGQVREGFVETAIEDATGITGLPRQAPPGIEETAVALAASRAGEEAARAAIAGELVVFALGFEPLFRFDALDVLADGGSTAAGELFFARDRASGASRTLLALRVRSADEARAVATRLAALEVVPRGEGFVLLLDGTVDREAVGALLGGAP